MNKLVIIISALVVALASARPQTDANDDDESSFFNFSFMKTGSITSEENSDDISTDDIESERPRRQFPVFSGSFNNAGGIETVAARNEPEPAAFESAFSQDLTLASAGSDQSTGRGFPVFKGSFNDQEQALESADDTQQESIFSQDLTLASADYNDYNEEAFAADEEPRTSAQTVVPVVHEPAPLQVSAVPHHAPAPFAVHEPTPSASATPFASALTIPLNPHQYSHPSYNAYAPQVSPYAEPKRESPIPKCAENNPRSWCIEDPEYPAGEIRRTLAYHFDDVINMYRDVKVNTANSVADLLEIVEETYLCPSETSYIKPLRAINKNGEWRWIVNDIDAHYEVLTQTARIEECTTAGESCPLVPECYTTKCLQKSNYHRFLVYDRYDRYLPFSIESFKLPSSCACYNGAYDAPYVAPYKAVVKA